MNIKSIKENILISDYLQREGFTPVRRSGGQAYFKAPYRQDSNPSLVVNDSRGLWYDHGEGVGGSIIDLAMKINSTTDVKTIVDRFNNIYNDVPVRGLPSRSQLSSRDEKKPHDLIRVKPLGNNFAITSYLTSRGIYDEAVRSKQVVEVYYDHISQSGERKRYFGAGWKNESGGYDIRSKYGKMCIDNKDIMSMKGNSGNVNIFEGMMNFLSALKEKTVSMKDTNIVMNTLSLSSKTINKIKSDETIKTVSLFLDNGVGGDKFTKMFLKAFPNLKDRRELYEGHGDYNEKIMAIEKKTLAQTR